MSILQKPSLIDLEKSLGRSTLNDKNVKRLLNPYTNDRGRRACLCSENGIILEIMLAHRYPFEGIVVVIVEHRVRWNFHKGALRSRSRAINGIGVSTNGGTEEPTSTKTRLPLRCSGARRRRCRVPAVGTATCHRTLPKIALLLTALDRVLERRRWRRGLLRCLLLLRDRFALLLDARDERRSGDLGTRHG